MSNFASTFRKKTTVQGSTIREQNITQANQTYLATFKNSGSYYSVGFGNKENKKDVQIFNLDAFKKLDTIKNMQYAPYQDLSEFRAGEYIYWNDTQDDMIWLITSTDKRLPQKPMSVIKKCNVDLNWFDENGIKHTQKAVFEDSFLYEMPNGSDEVKLQEGRVIISTQLNEFTEKIPADQTFIFGGDAKKKIRGQKYILRSKRFEANDYKLGEQLLTLMLEKTSDNTGSDDLYNNITNVFKEKLFTVEIQQDNIIQELGFEIKLSAIVKDSNNNVVDEKIVWSSSDKNIATITKKTGKLKFVGFGTAEIIASMENNENFYDTINIECRNEILPENDVIRYQLTPIISVLLRGDEETFNIFELINEIKQDRKFKITHSGVNNWNNYYSIEALSGDTLNYCNKFKIVNKNQYTGGNLEIKAYKIEDDLSEVEISGLSIRLGGLF